MAQREDIATLLQQLTAAFDGTIDSDVGSPYYSQVISPLLDAIGPDPLLTAPMDFIKDRLRKEYPSFGLDDDEPLMDMASKPLALIMGALSDQVLRIKQKQSLARPDLLTELDADDLMGNWFIQREQGLRPTVYVRVFYAVPTLASVNPSHRFFTGGGLNFFPPRSQIITSEEMASQRVGEEFFAEFLVRAELPGEEYSIGIGAISGVDGLPNHIRVSNAARASEGLGREDNETFVGRGRTVLAERSMTSPRGISAVVRDRGTVTHTEVVKYNDPEMERDILTGSGEGKLHLSGLGVVFGTTLLVWSGYEDRGNTEEVFVEPGYEVELHYGKLLYGLPPEQRHESFEVDSIIYDSRGAFPELPNILLLRLDHAPTPTSTVSGAIPGFLPGVSAAITRPGKIRISNIPGGIQTPLTDAGEVEINDGEVHIGGHHDVWLRPATQSDATITVTLKDEDPLVVGLSLQTFGASTPNVVASTDISIDWVLLGVVPGMYLVVDEGADVGVYRIVAVRQTQLVLDADLTAADVDIRFRVVDGLKLDLVQPRDLRIPFGTDAPGNDLETIIGSAIVVLNSTNSLSFGVEVGDTLRILEGDDEGDFLIEGFDPSGGGTTPIVDRPMSNSTAGLTYQIFKAEAGVQLPLVRIPAEGVKLLDSADQPTDISVPYALPLEARSLQAFTGAATKACGDLGFTMPGLGLAFENMGEACPSNIEALLSLLSDVSSGSDPAPDEIAQLLVRLASKTNLYSDECLECDGYIFCVTLDGDGIFLNYDLPAAGRTYVNSIMDWLTRTISAFFPSFVASSPPILEVVDGGVRVAWNRDNQLPPSELEAAMQFEVCIPKELVGCCSNLFIAFPDVNLDLMLRKLSDWVQAADTDINSDEAVALLREIINLLPAAGPPLCSAVHDDTLVINSGPNAGGYAVDTTYELSLDVTPAASGFGLLLMQQLNGGKDFFHFLEGLTLASILQVTGSNAEAEQLGSDIAQGLGSGDPEVLQLLQQLQEGLDEFRSVLKMCAVGIRGQFPVDPWKPYCEMFASGFPTIPPLPGVPGFEAEICDSYGDNADPFNLLVDLIAWVFESLRLLGFDLPESFDITFSEILSGVLNGMKAPYCVGSRTCDGKMRLYFHEPTTIEIDSGGNCVAFYDPTNVDPAQFPYDSTGCTSFWQEHAQEQDWIAGFVAGYADGLLDPLSASDALGYTFADLAAGLPGTYKADVLAVVGPSYRPAGFNPVTYDSAYAGGYLVGWGLDLGTPDAPATLPSIDGFTHGLADGILESAGATLDTVEAIYLTLGASYLPPGVGADEYRTGYSIGKITGLWSCLLTSDVGSFGTGAVPVVLDPRIPTLLSSTVGSAEVLFGGDASAPAYQVLPPQDTVDPTSPMDYPRDLSVAAPLSVDGRVFTALQLTDPTREAPLALGLQPYSDEIEIHEEVLLLRSSLTAVQDTVRVAVVATRNGSNVVTVLTDGVDFLGQGPAAAAGLSPVRVGDLLFLDEGADAGGFTVTRVVDGTRLELDRPLTDTSLPADKGGVDGSYDVALPTTFLSVAGTFDSNDVGKFLSVYSLHFPEDAGSYEILSVDLANGLFVTLDIPGGFAGVGAAVDWAVTSAPALSPADREDGGTELAVGRRIRIYDRLPASFTVVGISDSLDPAVALFYAWSPDQPGAAVFRGTEQPFRVVRAGVQRISSTQMAANRAGSLYYFDIWARALGTDEVHNVPAEQRFEAVFGTYLSEGYFFEVEDSNFTFSPEEKVAVRVSPSFLPVGRDDTLLNKVPLDGQRLQISYENAPAVADIHRVLLEPGARTTNANPIARHFLPSYVSVEVEYYGGEGASSVAARIQEKIQSLGALDSITVAGVVETALREAKATDWVHDIYLVTVTHDLDRRLVGNRSRDRLGGAEPHYFNGSNRLSYFIPGKDTSLESAEDLEAGDMIRALRITLPLDLR